MADAILKTCRCCGNLYPIQHQSVQRSKYCGALCRAEAMRARFEDRFWGRVLVGKDDECWVWQGSLRGEYGCVHTNGRTKSCHRVAYELRKGPIPDGLEIRHSCDNPPCCNPAHLSVGTHSENMRDMSDRGRGCGQVLVEQDVMRIRAMFFDEHIPQRTIAKAFGMSPAAISLAVRGVNWTAIGVPSGDLVKATTEMTRSVRRGTESNFSKMTPEVVRAMRAESASGSSQADIARKYGMSKMATSLAIRRKTWAHIE